MISRHVLPNIAAPLIVQATLAFAWAIINEAALSFLGLGTQPPTPSWGIMVSDGRQYMDHSAAEVVFAAAAIIVTVLSLNILGDGLRDALDPHQANRKPTRATEIDGPLLPAERRKIGQRPGADANRRSHTTQGVGRHGTPVSHGRGNR